MANINETINNIGKFNPELAEQVRKYVKAHNYGLVYEQNLPDAIRLYKKKAQQGDTVNILPKRGNSEKKENRITWVVNYIDSNELAHLTRDNDVTTASVDDLVPLVSYRDVIYPGLKEVDRVERGNENDPYHVVLNAENYHALEALNYAYAGKVDCIYIDPPYNTGAKDWKYNNDYVDGTDKYRHSKWLTFMERRLKIAKQLLNPNKSALIVTIDEKEYTRLGLLLDQLFPNASIQMISITNNPKGAKREKLFARTDEYIYIVLFGDEYVHLQGDSEEEEVRWFYLRRSDYASRRGTKKGGTMQFYPIYVDDTTHKIIKIGDYLSPEDSLDSIENIQGATAVFPIKKDGLQMNWGVTGESLKKLVDNGLVRVSVGNKNQPYIFKYISTDYERKISEGRWAIRGEREDGSKIVVEINGKVKRSTTVWQKKSYDAGQYGTTLLGDIIGNGKFNFPKSLYAVEDTLKYFVLDNPNALIVDFFAGSGTTLHATNLLNYEDGGHRRCICVTNNEVSNSESKLMTKEGLRQGDYDWEKKGIANYVTWPRTKYSIKGIDFNGNPLGNDYGVYHEDYVVNKEDYLVSRKTGKPTKKTIYKKIKVPDNEKISNLKMNKGFDSNAIFYELTYENPFNIKLDMAFNAIAPLLWMQAGCKGPIINKISEGYKLTDYYGVLFDYGYVSDFCKEVNRNPKVNNVFIVTDDQSRYSSIVKLLPNIEVKRLYEGYLKTFEIYGEGRFD